MANLMRLSRDGRWKIQWYDATKASGKAGRRWADCLTGDHLAALTAAGLRPEERAAFACGATNEALRRKLVTCYKALELTRRRDAARLKGRPALHHTPLSTLVDTYLALLEYRVSLNQAVDASPFESAHIWRSRVRERPMSPRTLRDIRPVLRGFASWAPADLTTGEVRASTVAGFLEHYLHREAGRRLSARTFNKHRTYLRGFFSSFTLDAARQYFKIDLNELFRDHIEPLSVPSRETVVYTVHDVAAFLDAAMANAQPDRILSISRVKNGCREQFQQRCSTPPAPVPDLALLLLCTGMRLGEALGLRWDDVDLERGVLTIRASKTGTTRYFPLVGDPTGDISPAFLDLLSIWRQTRPHSSYVLPENGAHGPVFPRTAWGNARRSSGLAQFGPQGCRRTCESALACIGVQSTLSAFWMGHSPQVAARHYLAYAPGRLPGKTLEATLGLEPYLIRLIEQAKQAWAPRMVAR